MADNGGSNAFLGFILGGIVVVLLIFGFIIYGGGSGTQVVKLEPPKIVSPAQ